MIQDLMVCFPNTSRSGYKLFYLSLKTQWYVYTRMYRCSLLENLTHLLIPWMLCQWHVFSNINQIYRYVI